jgi:tRNA G18 (ribose-2'-O)-methylase SpoU
METNLRVRSFDAPVDYQTYSALPRHRVWAVLDNLRSAFNVGSIFRTADAFRLSGVSLCGLTASPPHIKLAKTAMGTQNFVPWEYCENGRVAVVKIKSRGIPVWCLETSNRSTSLYECEFPEAVAIVVGNEALGVSPDILAQADNIIEIPMLGYKNSLNVGVAFGMVLTELLRQYQAKGWAVSRVAARDP